MVACEHTVIAGHVEAGRWDQSADETSFQKRHEYVTIVHDPREAKKRVLHVADGRGKDALKGFLSALATACV